MSRNSIALIGFMATGKTKVGKALVEYLGNEYEFIETDQQIIQEIGKSIPKIFAEEGEDRFREYEISVCERVSNLKNVVISCGGGVVLNYKNIENLKKNCYIVLLKASLEDIYKRLIKNGKEKRPVINKENLQNEIKNLLHIREPFYRAAAEFVIDTSNKTIKKIVREIVIKTGIKTYI
ncbi:MAG: shikimate kinase [Promethearchaeota archaeon]